ncbi:hypothetical protein [Fusobacterium sp.]|uniref:hypothetical protein n=1 Tax=Fusobacterium sp. TaxID=68766 RepID=UPI002904B882|nr:hypothetical protein [Fusobacterium sp.]MDU1910119.1 hypothetical protein [Fusobacterium sp.]
MKLKGEIVEIDKLDKKDIDEMYKLMTEYYDNMEKKAFFKDLYDKKYCIVLRDEKENIKGFSTQKIINFSIEEKKIYGIFSGDTIIHKSSWGSLELFRVFADFFFDIGEKYENFYWFLIVKGYKTYKILPTFFKEFYPNCLTEIPLEIKNIMDSFGENFYPGEYNKNTGIIEYKKTKDKLKEGIADITEKRLKDRDIKFFQKRNPQYSKGNDMVCITKLNKENLLEGVKSLLSLEREK